MLRSVANRGVFLGGVRIDGFGRYKSTVSGVAGLDDASAGQATPEATTNEARETVEEVPGEAKRGLNHRCVLTLDNDMIRPFIKKDAFIAPSATIVGYTGISFKTCIMHNSVIRGDLAYCYVGAYCVIEENVVAVAGTIANPSGDVSIEDYCYIGSGSVLRSCTIQRYAIVGNGSIIEENVFVGEASIVEPKSVVPAGTEIPTGQIWGGNPAKFKGNVDKFTFADRGNEMRAMCKQILKWYKPMYLPYSSAWLEKEALSRKRETQVAEAEFSSRTQKG
ncbi:hypothetical protein NDN08_001487 [Rhodosorus marinus]|uniref:Dynactin subunit 6 n=1 Tax=Rhodosorus marinus TaxID=101924 RepID=A0AAV8UQX7_9RHOD|nr:hypothetical protein NDN08_001487 [Rhodosorus marinus]